ncbi:gluconate 2-dehydrogenase subunit 3 family protein [Pseudopedobacter beijingensis]|uniref:Gluconate 2-dehydrogenase subunit 3 family protein n=1 Tax=Pseudopedobacter beijingensis TaxID=1207056 RepID=A0ABW4I8M2_9SPHI
MNRRDAISTVAMLLGGTLINTDAFAFNLGKNVSGAVSLFSAKDIALLDEIAETIIPETNTPGAKAAKTGEFMTVMINDCYSSNNRNIFIKGITKVDEEAKSKFSKGFMDCSPQERKSLLTVLDAEQKEFTKQRKTHYFKIMKELTLLGYFTSEVGGTQQLVYVEVPGRYDACIPYKKGDPVYLNP